MNPPHCKDILDRANAIYTLQQEPLVEGFNDEGNDKVGDYNSRVQHGS